MEAEVSRLVALIESQLTAKRAPSVALRLVANASPAPLAAPNIDPVTRDSHLRMIHHLRYRYREFGAQLLIDQATFGRASLHDLDGHELAKLHHDLHRAREYVLDGVSLEEAGLLHDPPYPDD